jgi:hypothetical protein
MVPASVTGAGGSSDVPPSRYFEDFVKQIRKRLTYANVMSSLAVFLVLGGATALAAKKIGANQLKANSVKTDKIVKEAVTTSKLRKNAVTTAKVRDGAVNSAKIADGSVTGGDINLGSTPFSRIIARFRGSASLDVPLESFLDYPLTSPTYTQAAEEVDSYSGAVDVTFQSGCTPPRSAVAYVLVDAADPTKPKIEDIAAFGVVEDSTGGALSRRIEAGPYIGDRFEPGTAKSRTVSLIMNGECKTGTGITATFGGVDVIGTK